MSEQEGGLLSCRTTCWIAGALLGLAAFLLILKAGVVVALFVGIVLGLAVGLILRRLFCAEGQGMAHHAVARSAAVSPGAGASAALDHADDARARAAADAAASAMMGDEETASGIADEGGRSTPAAALDRAAVAADAPARTHAEVQPEPSSAKEKSPASKRAATKAAPKPKAAPEATDDKTEGKLVLYGAPQGAADDLKLIKGVGPKLEAALNALGIWHYAQIAGWSKKEGEWVDAKLKVRGRIERDDWITQAKALARGEATEFSSRAAKTRMYDKK